MQLVPRKYIAPFLQADSDRVGAADVTLGCQGLDWFPSRKPYQLPQSGFKKPKEENLLAWGTVSLTVRVVLAAWPLPKSPPQYCCRGCALQTENFTSPQSGAFA